MSAKPVLHIKQWDKFSISAGFTTRHFPAFLKKTDDLSQISNQEKIKQVWKSNSFVYLNQVHAANIAVVKSATENSFQHISSADGVLTNLPQTTLLVLTADCLSIFFCAVKNKKASWIGLVHAGWRGTKEKIAQKAFILMMQKARCPAKDIHIAFGPAIGQKHYEVGEEFQEYFPLVGAQLIAPLLRVKGKLYFDLKEENKRQILEAGAHGRNIYDFKKDTFSDKDMYSFRREKDKAGRMISFIVKT